MFKALEKSNGQMDTTILLEAMSKDKVHLAKFILDALHRKTVDTKMEGAQTPLVRCVFLTDCRTRCASIELLLQRGAMVNCQDDHGRTALSYASERGYLDALKILVRYNADPEIVDVWGNTALMYAAVVGHAPVVEFLVRAFKRLGLKIERQNKVGNSAVEVAKFLGHTECLFALTKNAKWGRDNDKSAELKIIHPKETLGSCGSEKNDRHVSLLVDRLECLQTYAMDDNSLEEHAWQLKPCDHRKFRLSRPTLQPIDSTEEFERQGDRLFAPPKDLVFSGILTPKPPPRQTTTHKHPKFGDKLSTTTTTTDNQLPPLRGRNAVPGLYSPRPGKTVASKPFALSNSCTPSPLCVLLTPIKREIESEREKHKGLEFGERRFHESYYQKRCSLPASFLHPAPPHRTLMPLRKSQTIRRRTASPHKVELSDSTASATSPAGFSEFSSKLLRRFTFPEFKWGGGGGKELAERSTASVAQPTRGRPSLATAQIPRSETYPQVTRHPQVGSKSSVDSISSVKCEFDFHDRNSNS
ncbi:unnamed protein product [Lota lota]